MKKINSERYYERAKELLENLTEEEIVYWLSSPVTQALRLTIEGDVHSHYEQWAGGSFTDVNAEGTVQLNSKALGELASLEAIGEWIETLKEYKEAIDGA
jgi:hypothetical protein